MSWCVLPELWVLQPPSRWVLATNQAWMSWTSLPWTGSLLWLRRYVGERDIPETLLRNGNQTSSKFWNAEVKHQAASSVRDTKKKGCFTDGVETNPSFNKSALGAWYVPAVAPLGIQRLTKTYSPPNGEQTDSKQTFTQVTILRYKVEEFTQ